MSDLDWKDWSGAMPMPTKTREAWLRDMIAEGPPNSRTRFVACGDSIVIAAWSEDGSVSIYDCAIRRGVIVPGAVE